MTMFRVALALALALGVSGCGSKFKPYDGPEVTQVYVKKSDRRL